MLDHRLRCWVKIKSTLDQCLGLAHFLHRLLCIDHKVAFLERYVVRIAPTQKFVHLIGGITVPALSHSSTNR